MKHRGTEDTENNNGERTINSGNYWSCNRSPQAVGPGLLEAAYRACLAYELRKGGFTVIEEKPVPVFYDEVQLECGFRADLLVNKLVVVELKAKTAVHPVDKAQTLSHLRLLNLRVGLLINFHEEKLIDGVHRIINGY